MLDLWGTSVGVCLLIRKPGESGGPILELSSAAVVVFRIRSLSRDGRGAGDGDRGQELPQARHGWGWVGSAGRGGPPSGGALPGTHSAEGAPPRGGTAGRCSTPSGLAPSACFCPCCKLKMQVFRGLYLPDVQLSMLRFIHHCALASWRRAARASDLIHHCVLASYSRVVRA